MESEVISSTFTSLLHGRCRAITDEFFYSQNIAITMLLDMIQVLPFAFFRPYIVLSSS